MTRLDFAVPTKKARDDGGRDENCRLRSTREATNDCHGGHRDRRIHAAAHPAESCFFLRVSLARIFAGCATRHSIPNSSSNCKSHSIAPVPSIPLPPRGSPSDHLDALNRAAGPTHVAAGPMELGSNFVLGKPLDAGRLGVYFKSSLHKMETEHRRYFRYQLTLDAEVVRRDGKIIPAQILNVSDGGLALRLLERAHLQDSATLRFALPSAQQTVITAIAVLCWSREPIFGMKLFGMDKETRKASTEWLSSMGLT